MDEEETMHEEPNEPRPILTRQDQQYLESLVQLIDRKFTRAQKKKDIYARLERLLPPQL